MRRMSDALVPPRAPVIAVFGSSTARAEDPLYHRSVELGRALAERGAAVVSGGYGGVMEAVSRGAREAGGHVVGVTVEMFEFRGGPNRWVSERVHTSDLFERLRQITHMAHGYVVPGGSVGTLNELFLAWTFASTSARPRPPVVLLGAHWRAWLDAHRHPDLVPERLFRHVVVTDTPAEAAERVLADVRATRAMEPA